MSYGRGINPPIPSVLFKAFDRDLFRISYWQAVISAISWCVLGIVVVERVRSPWAGLFGMMALLTFSLTDNPFLWHGSVLSESISHSLGVLLLASWLLYVQRQTWLRTFSMLSFGLIYGLSRDPSAYVVGMIGILFILWEIVRALGRRSPFRLSRFLIGLVFFSSVILCTVSANGSNRWIHPFCNIITKRVLTSEERLKRFEELGMPVNDTLRSRAGKYTGTDDYFIRVSPKLGEFQDWYLHEGQKTLLVFMATDLDYSFLEPARVIQHLLSHNIGFYANRGFQSLPPGRLWNALVTPKSLGLYLFLAGFMFGTILCMAEMRNHPLTLAAFWVGLLGIYHIYVAWHGDGAEVPRHCYPGIMQMHVSAIFALIVLIDYAFAKMPGRVSEVGTGIGTHAPK